MHILDIDDLSREEILKIIDKAFYFKEHRKEHEKFLKDKSFALIFEKPSTRTRISFDLAIYESGGHSIIMNQNEIHLGKKESIKDTARVISRYVDGIIARVNRHSDLEEMAKYSDVPVINALSNLSHPCQILADLMTIKEHKKSFEVKVAYLGDGNNVCNSLILGCSILGIDIYVATPKGYEPNSGIVLKAKKFAEENDSVVLITNDPKEVAKDADVIYTDVWLSMGDKKDLEEIKKIFPPYQVNSKLLELAKEDVIVMHCLPASRGMEITDDVIDGDRSVVYDQAENRLHAQKALLYHIYK
ncbi:ornithine carbamoyltransferase [Methanocaldococcus infernus ME]|uniref:Ornithine carbamoyltransferase n=1 Tax=Methanocaldococcus infernus (strain DSM 11812 / JCM 15783 / ME) TaxID=573063 RepID=D5VR03_METIM|nr:ornithine carbamoyltransferase [Methanocaldococcus infernus]ADG13006.1 ornithine carbamoyltransferase [Methanocaldococcus infernus ME]